MSKTQGRSNAAFFCNSSTERATSKRTSQRRTRAGYTDGVIGGRRVLIAEPAVETEKGLMTRIRVALAAMPGVLVWRNNVGVDADHGVRYGLGVGSADLVGIVMVRGHGVFAGWEVKVPGRKLREEQRRWIDTVRRFGGIAGRVESPEEAIALVTEARRVV